MAQLQTPSLARWIQCMESRRERMREAIPAWLSELPALSPRPTSWADVAASDQDPDVYVRRDGDTLAVELNSRGLPEGFDVTAETDAGDAVALAEGYAKVGTLIVGITKAIVAREHAFFLQDGPRAAMFRERDIGEDVNVHESSVRRICEARALEWKGHRIPLMAFFFVDAVKGDDGRTVLPKAKKPKKG